MEEHRTDAADKCTTIGGHDGFDVINIFFAYRDTTQESIGFSPFELVYGHTVRGPMRILRELWTKEVTDPDIKQLISML